MKKLPNFYIENLVPFLIFLLVFSFGTYFFSTKYLSDNFYDWMLRLTNTVSAPNDVVIVAIDNKSIDDIGSLPWNRQYYADIFEYLQNHTKAKVIVFDALISTKTDEVQDNLFKERIKNFNKLVVGVDFNKSFNGLQSSQPSLKKEFRIPVEDNRSIKYIKNGSYNYYKPLLDGYLNNIRSVGGVNVSSENDGKIRYFEPFIKYHDDYYPSLALSAFIKLYPIENIQLFDDYYSLYMKNKKIINVPITEGRKQNLRFFKPIEDDMVVAHKIIPASLVIKDFAAIKNAQPTKLDSHIFDDKVVVVGATTKELFDIHATPIYYEYPGVAIQATAIDDMINSFFVKNIKPWQNVLIILLLVLVSFLINYFLTPIYSVIGILFLEFLYFYIALFAYSNGYAIDVITPALFVVLSSILTFLLKFLQEAYKKNKLQNAMEKYINTNVVNNIINDYNSEINLGGKKSEVTILISDIRGFTRISETLEPTKVSNLLNEYFEQMIPIIEKYGGCVNKFIGDAILAVFNEPNKDKQHAQNAVFCAYEMVEKVKELKKKWKHENKPNIGISIGINTGTAFIGNIGTPDHLEYTVIGDTVNVASRIESQNRQFNTQLLISETTYEKAQKYLDVIKINSVEIRGREGHINIYEVINIINKDENNR